MSKKMHDITESVAAGDVNHLISVLIRWREIGYDRLYFDGYEAAVYLYESKDEATMQTFLPNELVDKLFEKWKKDLLGEKN